MTRGAILRAGAFSLVWSVFGAIPVSGQMVTPGMPASAPAPVRETVKLTLEEAVRRAVDHNPDLAVVRLGIEVDTERVGEARGAYQPVFQTVLARSSTTTPPSNLLLGTEGIDTTDLFATVGIRQRLRWGAGTWSVSWDGARTATNSPLTAFDPSLQAGLRLAFSQPLLRDRRMDSARAQSIIAQRNVRSSEFRFRESVVQTIAAVKQAYWTLKATLAHVTVQQQSLSLAEDLVRQNRARVEVGQAPPLDLVQAEAEVATRRENLIRAQAITGDAEDRLRRLIIDPADLAFWQVALDPVDEPAGSTAPLDVEHAIAGAIKDRYDLAVARHNLDNADTNVQLSTDQKRPDLRVEASYRGVGAGGTQIVRSGPFPGVVTGQLNTGYGDTLGQVFRNSYPTWSVGVAMSYPLGRSYEDAALARAEIQRRQATYHIASLELQIAESIRQAARQVQSTTERVGAARAGQTLAEQRYAVENRRFEAGLSTTFLVTQAQRDLLQAQVNLLQAMLDHQSSLISFEAVQLAPASPNQAIAVRGADVVLVPTPSPQGLFRQGGGN